MYAAIRQQVVTGAGLKTVVMAAPLTKMGLGLPKSRPLVLLLDSGADDDIIFLPDDELRGYNVTPLAHPNVWSTSNGKFETDEIAQLNFVLPEFSQSKVMSCTADVRRIKDKRSVQYDAIIGIKTLHEWGVLLNFRDRLLDIDGIARPMKHKDDFKDRQQLYNIYNEATEPLCTKEETARTVRILDANYEAADFDKIVEENCQHLSKEQRSLLLNLLKKHETMFSGELGEWKGDDVHFELKPNVKPYRGKWFPVPQIHKATIMTELE